MAMMRSQPDLVGTGEREAADPERGVLGLEVTATMYRLPDWKGCWSARPGCRNGGEDLGQGVLGTGTGRQRLTGEHHAVRHHEGEQRLDVVGHDVGTALACGPNPGRRLQTEDGSG